MNFHDLRHSATTLYDFYRCAYESRTGILGYSSFMTTADPYAHMLLVQQPEAMKHWDDEFGSNEPRHRKVY